MKILVKNSDKLVSTIHDSKVVNEYLVYVLDEGESPLYAEAVYGSADRDSAINKVFSTYFKDDNIKLSDVLEEVQFVDFIKTLKDD
jgi:hypothetical protein|tara:strand:- start:40 stop:297 length:258 start_codon:yes stop_codon:yes gene_type:complete